MTVKGELAKEKIIRATTQLINDESDMNNISMRLIAKTAGLNVSSINYYFQTKDNLIQESIRIRGIRVIKRWFDVASTLNVDPVSKLRIFMKNLGEFYARHPNVMKILTHNEVFKYVQDDTLTAMEYGLVLPLLKEIFPEKSEGEIKLVISTVIGGMAIAFMRAIYYPHYNPFDFFDKVERDKYCNTLVDYMLVILKSNVCSTSE